MKQVTQPSYIQTIVFCGAGNSHRFAVYNIDPRAFRLIVKRTPNLAHPFQNLMMSHTEDNDNNNNNDYENQDSEVQEKPTSSAKDDSTRGSLEEIELDLWTAEQLEPGPSGYHFQAEVIESQPGPSGSISYGSLPGPSNFHVETLPDPERQVDRPEHCGLPQETITLLDGAISQSKAEVLEDYFTTVVFRQPSLEGLNEEILGLPSVTPMDPVHPVQQAAPAQSSEETPARPPPLDSQPLEPYLAEQWPETEDDEFDDGFFQLEPAQKRKRTKSPNED